MMRLKQFWLGVGVSVLILFSAIGGALADRLFVIKPLDYFLGKGMGGFRLPDGKGSLLTQKILNEEGVVIDVADKASPSVVTVTVVREQPVVESLRVDPFGMFGFGMMDRGVGRMETVVKDIGTGFVVEGGLIVTNKHVVGESKVGYKIVDKDGKEYKVEKTYRDPVNDLAILQVEGGEKLKVVELGSSNNLKVGQFVIAIGTALGEFRHTVTTGVISGLGRGITAGDGMRDFEQLDNVIQTDAAINPGNSGGPLLNSAGQVIGVNVAVAGNAQNVGFALPIDVVKESLKNFADTGMFSRPMLGVRYRMISKDAAILNEVPQGAYVVEVLPGSSAETGGVKVGDIVVSVDGEKLSEVKGGLASIVNKKKVGEVVEVRVWRKTGEEVLKIKLEEQEEE